MIGIYDSGIGGQSILDGILKYRPTLQYIYFKDTDNLPLGEKSTDEIIEIVKKGCIKLFEQGCKIVILACNTACVTAIRHIQQVWLPTTIYSGICNVLSITKPFIELLTEEHIGYKDLKGLLMATSATVRTGFYQYEFKSRGFDIDAVACPGLAKAIQHSNNSEITQAMTDMRLQINPEEYDYILYACTHYIYGHKIIKNFFFQDTIFLEPSDIVGRKLVLYLEKHSTFL